MTRRFDSDHLKTSGRSSATIKRHLSALRMLFSYMVSRGAMAYNPAREVKTDPIRRRSGKTPALSPEQMAQLFDSFDQSRLIDLRDRALIGAMAYNFASVPAAVQLTRANHADSRTTKIYDLRAERIEFVELARVRY